MKYFLAFIFMAMSVLAEPKPPVLVLVSPFASPSPSPFSNIVPVVKPPPLILIWPEFSVTLSWNPNSETDLAGYMLGHGFSKGVYLDWLDVGLVTLVTVIYPTLYDANFFVVVAYNTHGMMSPFSNEVIHHISLIK